MLYILMHKDDPVVVVSIDQFGQMTDVNTKVYNPALLPLRHQSVPNGLVKWWKERAVPLSRHGIEQFMQERGFEGPEEYLVKNLGLSLSDTYWIKPIDSNFSWSDINLYENDFRSDFFSTPGTDEDREIPAYSANSSLQGDVEKTWAIMNGERVLIKGNSSHQSSESLNEVLASEIYKRQGYDNYVPYELTRIKNVQYQFGCICKNFTTPNIELVPAYDLITSQKKDNQISFFQHMTDIAIRLGVSRESIQYDIDMQLLGDYVLSGNDRHYNNIGFLRDTDSLRLVRMAPIYDSGRSLFVGTEIPKQMSDFLKIQTNSFANNERKLLSYVQDKSVLDVTKLPSPDWVKKLYEQDPEQSEDRINSIVWAYEKKIEMLREIQLGKDPYQSLF